MKNYINGYSTPKFVIKDPDSQAIIDTIELNLCGSDGLSEEYEFIAIKHKLLNYSEYSKWMGYFINFTLSYSEYSSKSNSLKVMALINYILYGCDITLYPRTDVLSRVFDVNFAGDSMKLGILRGGINSVGNKGIELSFRTKNILTEINWIDPDEITVPIEDFAVL